MLIVSIAFNAHDSSITIANNENILLVLEAERYFRVKRKRCQTKREMEELIEYGLSLLGRNVEDITHWCGTAFVNEFLPDEDICTWTKRTQIKIFGQSVPFFAVNHHLAHASFFYCSPFDHAVIKSCDGGGDGQKHVFYLGSGRTIEPLPETNHTKIFNGTFYDVVSSYIYGRDGNDGKFMGLSSYGEIDYQLYDFFDNNCDFLCNKSYTDPYLYPKAGWEKLAASDFGRFNVNDKKIRAFAKTAQVFFEDKQLQVTKDFEHYSNNLVYVGGSALNILANSIIRQEMAFKDIFIPPCCDDTGQSLGALLYYMNNELGINPKVKLPFLGPGKYYKEEKINPVVVEQVIRDLLGGNVVAWHYGRGEIGPRALGHRSLLTSPQRLAYKILVSEQIKQRESYRPVAPIVFYEAQASYFDAKVFSPYMLFGVKALEITKTKAPAIVHVDGSARLQSINESFDPYMYQILKAWYAETGIPMLINTSLNGFGDPIANTYEDTLQFAKGKQSLCVYLDACRLPN